MDLCSSAAVGDVKIVVTMLEARLSEPVPRGGVSAGSPTMQEMMELRTDFLRLRQLFDGLQAC